ncbi:MAG: class I SAM-dependent methyltransferase [Candidatus Bathyarchaeia archaeon]
MSEEFRAALLRRLLEFPYLPSPLGVIEAALNMVKVKPDSVFADLGCGDGRVLIKAAEKFGIYCVGFEINPILAALARRNIKDFGVGHLVDVVCADIFTVDFSKFNAIYVYPFPTIIDKLSEKIAIECSRGTQILVHDYPLKGLNPSQRMEIHEKGFHVHLIYLYII